jgi:5-methylcytosine-specific restriction endonuclease McrA
VKSHLALNRTNGGKHNCLVLNASYEPINVIADTRAVVLILQGKAESVLDQDRICAGDQEALMFPSVIRLTYMAAVPRMRQVPLSRRALFQRDNFTCQYCGEKPDRLEVEHVVPRSHGGRNVWENVVTSCRACNAHKRDRTPDQAGMRLLSKPYAPSRVAMIASRGHDEWEEFLVGHNLDVDRR